MNALCGFRKENEVSESHLHCLLTGGVFIVTNCLCVKGLYNLSYFSHSLYLFPDSVLACDSGGIGSKFRPVATEMQKHFLYSTPPKTRAHVRG